MIEQSVALISAASALAGVAVTGGFTLLKGRQERLDKEIDREEQRRVMHREARRDAYSQFLSAYHETARGFQEVKKLVPPAHVDDPAGDEMDDLEAAIIALQEAGSNVTLEGPPQVQFAADELVEACRDLNLEYTRLCAAKCGQTQRLYFYDSPDRDQADVRLRRAYRSFQEQARSALGGDSPGWA
ncbi:hypothetical protein ABZ027_38560 [Streptomyces sp. NPDC006332]|uniref:hypothetical protein n=1 Tax=Streptomyces sp. NPDC006332 TaxID=3155456 RepID=UPI0033AE85D9